MKRARRDTFATVAASRKKKKQKRTPKRGRKDGGKGEGKRAAAAFRTTGAAGHASNKTSNDALSGIASARGHHPEGRCPPRPWMRCPEKTATAGHQGEDCASVTEGKKNDAWTQRNTGGEPGKHSEI